MAYTLSISKRVQVNSSSFQRKFVWDLLGNAEVATQAQVVVLLVLFFSAP